MMSRIAKRVARLRERLGAGARSSASLTGSRLLALALLIPAAALVYGGALHWYVSLRLDQAARINSLRERLVHYQDQAARLGQARSRLQALQAARRDHPYLLDQSAANVAAAELNRRLERAVGQTTPEQRACRVRRTNSRSATAESVGGGDAVRGFDAVHLQVELDCGIHGVADVLPALEGESPYLLIDDFQLRRTNRTELRGSVQAARLHVRFTLTGFILGDTDVETRGADAPADPEP